MKSKTMDVGTMIYTNETLGNLINPYLPTGWRAAIVAEIDADSPIKYNDKEKIVYVPKPPKDSAKMIHYMARIHTVLGTVDKFGAKQAASQSQFKFQKADGSTHPVSWVYSDLLSLSLYSSTVYEGRRQVLEANMTELFETLDEDNLSNKMLRYHKALARMSKSMGMDSVADQGDSGNLDKFIEQELGKIKCLKELYKLARRIIDKLDEEDDSDDEPEEVPQTGGDDSIEGDGVSGGEEVDGDSSPRPIYQGKDVQIEPDNTAPPYMPPMKEESITIDYTVPITSPRRVLHGLPGSYTIGARTTRIKESDSSSKYGLEKADQYAEVIARGLPLGRQLRTMLTEETRSRRKIADRGRLIGSRLHMLPLGGTRTFGEGAKKQFVQASTNYEMNSHLTILVDLSGSMGGQKAVYAAACVNILVSVLFALRASFSVLGFTDTQSYREGRRKTSLLMKRLFDSRKEMSAPSPAAITERLDYAFGAMASNPDTDAVFYGVMDAFQSVSAKRKVILVLSDGQPASSRLSGCNSRDLAELVAQVEARPDTSIFGLGILSDAVTEYYPAHAVIKSISDVLPTMLDFVHHNIIKQN